MNLPRYDAGKDNYIDLMELKMMMEKLGAPQTHIGLKNMMKEVDEDLDNMLSFREVEQAVFIYLGNVVFPLLYSCLCVCALSTVSADLQEGSSGRAGRGQWPQCPRSPL